MPISAENMRLYPGGSTRSPEWAAIRKQVMERAGNRCEGCGVEDRAIGVRLPDEDYRFEPTPELEIGEKIDCERENENTFMKVFRIVCTVAHVDGGLTDHSLDNLRFWCQRCHNRHDAPMRVANRKSWRNKP